LKGFPWLDERPIIVALAGPNGAGKTTFCSLQAAIRELPHVLVFSNDDLRAPFRRLAVFERGRLVQSARAIPRWLRPLLKPGGAAGGTS
jgi:predicted AAA+ superfamily ATPase